MPTWNSEQYLKFAPERTQPAVDLAARIGVESPKRVVDLGCGPGNSTAVLARKWPEAELIGLDQSPPMIESARATSSSVIWQVGDMARWQSAQPVDVVFSNAALQWVDDHARVIPHLLQQVAAGGAFAFQVPANFDAPGHRLLREIGGSAKWKAQFHGQVREWHVEEPAFYYDALASQASRLELWVTEYLHVLPGHSAIVEWYRGTGARPWLEGLSDDTARTLFLEDYLRELSKAFPSQADGNVLFPFRRLFVIAYR